MDGRLNSARASRGTGRPPLGFRVLFGGVGAAVVALAALTIRLEQRPGRLPVQVIGYQSTAELRAVAVHIGIPEGRQLTQDRRKGAPPMLQVIVETSQGWLKSPAAEIASEAVWQMHPGAANTLVLALPLQARRWRLVLSGRKAGMRERAVYRLMKAQTWASDRSGRLRPILRWCVRQLPNRPGRVLQYQSDVFEVNDSPRKHWYRRPGRPPEFAAKKPGERHNNSSTPA